MNEASHVLTNKTPPLPCQMAALLSSICWGRLHRIADRRLNLALTTVDFTPVLFLIILYFVFSNMHQSDIVKYKLIH